MIVTVKYPFFSNFSTELPINWCTNPFKNKNWLHNFNSLRWLKNEEDLVKTEMILRDYYKFHCVKNKNNPYYSSIRGDHSASIRLGVLYEIAEKFKNKENISGFGICNRLIIAEIANLHRKEMYRSGHNHGLMVDISLLDLLNNHRKYEKYINIELLLDRSSKTLDSIWDTVGVTTEHSISYQEYNAALTIKYFHLINKLGLLSKSKIDLEKVYEESRKLLGYALRDNKEYFPMGDSFRSPNLEILNEIFNNKSYLQSAEDLLSPYASQYGEYLCSRFVIVRKNIAGYKIHFSATCCWDSANHKKNDELSFALDVNGIAMFEMPGWGAFAEKSVNDYMSTEYAHSTIIAPGVTWQDPSSNITDVGRSFFHFPNNNFFEGIHHRIPGVIISRRFYLNKNPLEICEHLETKLSNQLIISRMILAKDVNIEKNSSHIILRKNNIKILIWVESSSKGFFLIGTSKIIASERNKICDVKTLDYVRSNYDDVVFKIKLEDDL